MGMIKTIQTVLDWTFVNLGLKSKRLLFFYDFSPYQRELKNKDTLVAFGFRFTRWGLFRRLTPVSFGGVRFVATSIVDEIEFDLPWTERNNVTADDLNRPRIVINGVNIIEWIAWNCSHRVDIFVTITSSKQYQYRHEYMVSVRFTNLNDALLFKLSTGANMRTSTPL